MGGVFGEITGELRKFIEAQRLFFVASAPLAGDGRVNLSPKGLDSLRVLDARTVAYLDFVGSGAETIAHLRENGRVVLMFCAFDGPPKIVRLHGAGDVLLPDSPEHAVLRSQFPDCPGARAIIRVCVNLVITSCGYAVPLMQYEGDRDQLV